MSVKHEVLSLIPSPLSFPQKISGAHWPSSEPELMSSRSVRNPVSKEADDIPEDEIRGCPLAAVCMCMHVDPHT